MSVAILLSALPGVLACASSANRSRSSPPASSYLITAEQIEASGAATAWDALRLTAPFLRFAERRGVPTRIQRRGRASIYLDDQPRVIIDEVRVWDIRVLDEMPASDILWIHVLSGLDATTYYGGISTSGAIVIRTKGGGSP